MNTFHRAKLRVCEEHSAATKSVDELLARAMAAVEQLDALMRIELRDDAATLAEWVEASRIQPCGGDDRSQVSAAELTSEPGEGSET